MCEHQATQTVRVCTLTRRVAVVTTCTACGEVLASANRLNIGLAAIDSGGPP